MADLKISQLSSATALAGSEVVPVVQGGSTKKATIDQILAPANGKGINFAAAGGDTLTIYDEGTWTPNDASGAGLTFAAAAGFYVRVGSLVVATCHIIYPSTANANACAIGGLPFPCIATPPASMFSAPVSVTTYAVPITGVVGSSSSTVSLLTFGATSVANANLSGQIVRFTAIYRA